MSAKWITVYGLGFGDEGKGSIVDWLCDQAEVSLVARYCGGPQSDHRIVTPHGASRIYNQLGQGWNNGISTLLTAYTAVDLLDLIEEADEIQKAYGCNALDYIHVSEDAPLVLPIHAYVIKHLELNRPPALKHGTTGVGTGAIYMHSYARITSPITVKDIGQHSFRARLSSLYSWACEVVGDELRDDLTEGLSYATWADKLESSLIQARDKISIVNHSSERALLSEHLVVLEGSGGMLIDRNYGFYPYTTYSSVGPDAVDKLKISYNILAVQFRLGVTRSYHTNYGYGPLPSHREVAPWRVDQHIRSNTQWTGAMRMGDFDMPLYKYACAVSTPNGVVMTHMDHAEKAKVIEQYNTGIPGNYANIIDLPLPVGASSKAHQSALATKLLNCTPATGLHNISVLDLLETNPNIAPSNSTFNSKMVACSWGPTRKQKQFTAPDLKAFLI